jgi:hypothetical protein
MVLKFKLLQYDWFLKSGPYIWSITFILEFIRKQILKLYPTLVKSEMTEIGDINWQLTSPPSDYVTY